MGSLRLESAIECGDNSPGDGWMYQSVALRILGWDMGVYGYQGVLAHMHNIAEGNSTLKNDIYFDFAIVVILYIYSFADLTSGRA